MRNKQNGFGVAGILIIIVIVGLLCTIGWLVYIRQHDARNSSQLAISQNSGHSKTAPASYTTYKNTDVGFSFSYPKAWGSVVTTTPTNNDHLLLADTFDKQTDISFAVAPNDYTGSENMGDSPCVENGFGVFEYLQLTNSQYYSSKELTRTASKQVVESYKSGYCTGMTLRGRAKLNLRGSNGVDITYFKQSDLPYSGTVQEYMKGNNVAEPLKSDFLKVVDSFKAD